MHSAARIEFDEAACVCGHPPGAHDDGFGCTEADPEAGMCPCTAGWIFPGVSDA